MVRQRIAVIGGVAAGPAAAAEAHRVDPGAEVVLFEQGPYISYGACEMPYYLSGQIPDADKLIILTPEQFERTRGAKVFVRHRVQSMHPQRNRLMVENLADGSARQERFDKFILALGAHARMPELAGREAPNVFALRTLRDAFGLKAYLEENEVRHAVVLGGGYVGLEAAESLRALQIRVTILQPDGRLLARYLDDALRPLVAEAVRRHGVIVRAERATALEQGGCGRVHAVHTDKGEKIGCQLVVAAMGITPNTGLAERAGIRMGNTGALAVDAQMRTNLPNVWACGDCVEVERVVDERRVHVSLSMVAFRTARVAARNAARRGHGRPARFEGVCPASAVKAFGLEVASVGLRIAEAQAAGFDAVATSVRHWSRVSFYPGAERLHVRLVAERSRGRLLGAELVGAEGAALRADVLVPLIREGWTVDQLLEQDLIYTPPLAPAHDPLLVAAAQARRDLGRPR